MALVEVLVVVSLWLLVVWLLLCVVFCPYVIACKRKIQHQSLVGWMTLLGLLIWPLWFAALLIACVNRTADDAELARLKLLALKYGN